MLHQVKALGALLSAGLIGGLVFVPTVVSAQPKVIQCYQKELVPAQYTAKQVLIKKAERKYIERSGQVQLVEYPAVYREDLTLYRASYYLLRPVPCKNVPSHLLPDLYQEQPAQHVLRQK